MMQPKIDTDDITIIPPPLFQPILALGQISVYVENTLKTRYHTNSPPPCLSDPEGPRAGGIKVISSVLKFKVIYNLSYKLVQLNGSRKTNLSPRKIPAYTHKHPNFSTTGQNNAQLHSQNYFVRLFSTSSKSIQLILYNIFFKLSITVKLYLWRSIVKDSQQIFS